MSDIEEVEPLLFSCICDRWSPEHTKAGLRKLERRRTRQQVRRAVLAGALGVLVAAAAMSRAPARPDTVASGAPRAAPRAESEGSARRFDDGSLLVALSPTSQLAIERDQADRVDVRLVRGGYRFDVTHRPERPFVVAAGQVAVRVLGTRFDVEVAGRKTRVAVLRGRVRVEWPEGQVELTNGQSGTFPPGAERDPDPDDADAIGDERADSAREDSTRDDAERDDSERDDSELDVPSTELLFGDSVLDGAGAERPALDETRSGRRPGVERHERASRGSGRAARAEARAKLRAGDRAPPARRGVAEVPAGAAAVTPPPIEGADALLRAADAARIAGEPEAAVGYLQRFMAEHRTDDRTALAAFTLGRVLLRIGRARDAAAAFAESRALEPGGLLAEDALAREVECWARAGHVELAGRRAREYLDRYPSGRRSGLVRRLGLVSRP